ncbi:M20/M25/M40 family metallo-hydrolase [Sphingosinicella sp. YJ22]|uniref:M20/M25/M40 family metallo-hydrolase n=1 Tax=Sphingosinicella sp. YJ22 TaxID=1104780 RepID=UPI001408FB14|nr:M20/M25/M40 family metallo-hydrolase [Sphingosinicella sp. YJ22]
MKMFAAVAALALLSSTAIAQTAAPPSPDRVAELRDDALENDRLAWDLVEGLTTEIGPRLAGSEAEARARQWAVARLRGLGFSNVRVETFGVPYWERGIERAEILSPYPQPLVLTALGNSGATPAAGIEAEVVGYDSMEAFQAAPAEEVRGKIVFVNHAMQATQDGSHYGPFGAARREGPTLASRRGAAAILVRSIGTDHHRNPHTGVQSFAEGVRPIPAAALSLPDAEQLQRVLRRAAALRQPVRLRLVLTPRQLGTRQSGNVIAEVPGSDPAAGTILIGGHLDSWDLGTGAFDNAAGVAITTAAAHRVMSAGQPRRTIRVVLFGSEEIGVFGGADYFRRHRGDGDVVLVGESDFGADRVWRVNFNLAPGNEALQRRIAAALAPLGIAAGRQPAGGGADLGAWARAGIAAVDLSQDGTRYFDFHHTPDDTLDKVDPAQLRQNVAAWTAMLAEAANAPERIEPAPAR